jgi:hypothetical protein
MELKKAIQLTVCLFYRQYAGRAAKEYMHIYWLSHKNANLCFVVLGVLTVTCSTFSDFLDISL